MSAGGDTTTTTVITVEQGAQPKAAPQAQEDIKGILPMVGEVVMGLARRTKKAVYVERATPAQSLRETGRDTRQAERSLKRSIADINLQIRATEAQEEKATTEEELRRIGMRRATQVALRTRFEQDLAQVCNVGNLVAVDSSANHVSAVQASYLRSVRARQTVSSPASIQRDAMAGQKLLATDSIMRDMKKDLGVELGGAFDETLEDAIDEEDAATEAGADCKTAMARRVDERVDKLMERRALRQKSQLPTAGGQGDARVGASAPCVRDESILKRMDRLRLK